MILLCVCDQPEHFCGGDGDVEPNDPNYCKACDDLDHEDHCLNCPFECCNSEDQP